MLNESDLISCIKEGDISAFNEFYKRNWRKLYHTAYRATNSSEDAGDLVQAVFVNLWNSRHGLDSQRYHPSYLSTALKNKLINFYKQNLTYKKKLEEIVRAEGQQTSLNNSIEEKLIAKETAASINRSIEDLPKKMQQIFILSRRHNLSINEISETLNITPRTVKNQISNAIIRIKREVL